MAHLTQVEFNYIREFYGPAVANRTKFQTYAQQAQDPAVKQLFQDLATSCNQKVSTFMHLL